MKVNNTKPIPTSYAAVVLQCEKDAEMGPCIFTFTFIIPTLLAHALRGMPSLYPVSTVPA